MFLTGPSIFPRTEGFFLGHVASIHHVEFVVIIAVDFWCMFIHILLR
jgi:hypothetical protein